MSDLKLCKDCEFIENAQTLDYGARCLNPAQPVTDLVHGQRPLCVDARRAPAANAMLSAVAPDFSSCGPSGRLWKERIPEAEPEQAAEA